ncbi:uncharacterized protein LOC103475078 [Poecilia reticulata]|uniref:uncharacterized protein LOC103475078 n=1 Tax=Poecilia reticulata TaxID=8081 RepID=UPI0004A340DB|nr:PREDICTED: uncharacterized protein LOC103475078 [Poecilia reticulata]XP_017163848.1 PREDICTED: uncharacterized protein LOC103475078 [Poecilia reticulata]
MWLIFTALLAASLNPQSQASVTFASTCRVKGQPEEELILHCGDGEHEGVVQFWHTPFGDLQSSGSQSKLDPVFMHHDGNLVIPNSSIHHGGLYYCILRHTEGSMLWPFELHVDQNMVAEAEDGRSGGGCATRRFRRNAASTGEREAVFSEGIFAGAVAASVLLTFVVGFSAGALSRTPVLRCLKSLAPKKRRPQPDVPDGSRVTMTTLPPMYDNQAYRTGAMPHDSRFWQTTETPTPLTTPSPPAKPMRSFRLKVEEKEEPEGTAYLEGCDSNRAEEETGSGEDGEAQEEEDSGQSDENEDEEGSETEDREEEEDGEASALEEEVKEEEKQKTDESEELEQESSGTDEERSVKAEAEPRGEDPPSGSHRRRSRVIRLYQYDEDGQRYGHLPDPEAPEAAPRPRQRSRSLTRLNAIMAAAATGPMERTEPEDEKHHFHMDI